MQKRSLLIITNDHIGAQMAGPAIRCCEIARQLATVCAVSVTSRLPISRDDPALSLQSFQSNRATLLEQAREADILMVQGTILRWAPELAELGKYMIVDLYDPLVFESYPFYASQGAGRDAAFLEFVSLMDEQMLAGDFFVCASDRQRDMWLGRFCSLGRLTPALFEASPAMDRLIGLVPFGLQDEPPQRRQPALRGVVPGIAQDDFIMLWGGGVWNWFDPLTVIRAVGELNRPDIKLYFMGIKHPSPEAPESHMAHRAMELARELGIEGRNVFFNTGWVPYDDRQDILMDADVGITAHFASIETRFSFRTRVLDYLWAGLPILTTTGDSMAELVTQRHLGAAVGCQDVEGWKQAIIAMADDSAGRRVMTERINTVAKEFQWSVTCQPLLEYCRNPYRTPRTLKKQPRPSAISPAYLISRAVATLRHEGLGPLWRKGRTYVGLRF